MRSLQLIQVTLSLALLYITGCNSATRNATITDSASTVVTVVGDETKMLAIDELAKHGLKTVSTLDMQNESSVIVIVLDSTVGPLPIHLEIAKSIKKRPTNEYMWVFTKTALVDDQELLELEELECREIFNSQGFPGDEITFGFDSPSAKVAQNYKCPRGWAEIARHVRNLRQ